MFRKTIDGSKGKSKCVSRSARLVRVARERMGLCANNVDGRRPKQQWTEVSPAPDVSYPDWFGESCDDAINNNNREYPSSKRFRPGNGERTLPKPTKKDSDLGKRKKPSPKPAENHVRAKNNQTPRSTARTIQLVDYASSEESQEAVTPCPRFCTSVTPSHGTQPLKSLRRKLSFTEVLTPKKQSSNDVSHQHMLTKEQSLDIPLPDKEFLCQNNFAAEASLSKAQGYETEACKSENATEGKTSLPTFFSEKIELSTHLNYDALSTYSDSIDITLGSEEDNITIEIPEHVDNNSESLVLEDSGIFDSLLGGKEIVDVTVSENGVLTPDDVALEGSYQAEPSNTSPPEPLHSNVSDKSNSEPKKRTRTYTPPEKLTRKRKCNRHLWKSNIAKIKLNNGEEHLNVKGKLIPGRSIQPPCSESCRLQCFSKVSEENRQQIFQQFWKKLESKARKWEFIARYVKCFPKKENGQNSSNRRVYSRKYFLRVNEKDVQVCKVMFLGTLDICDGWVSTSLKKLGVDGVISPDKRGTNPKSRPQIIPENTKESVIAHLNSLEKQEAHLVREQSQKEYLTDRIQTTSKLHELYSEWIVDNRPGVKPANERQYRDIFNYETNIEFFTPKKDQCDDCYKWEHSSPEERQKLQAAREVHRKNKEAAQNLRAADTKAAKAKGNRTLCVACFDYEKTLICPKGTASVFYYKRKLGVYNFTVADSGKNDNFCYVYDETIAKKGANEVGSFLIHFIQQRVSEGITTFIFYCDNCFGQNKNRFVASFLCYAAEKFKVRITLRFLEKGHTYNSADTVHSIIERATRKSTISVPSEWYEKMRTAKRSKFHPLRIIEVSQNMVFDSKDLAGKLNLDTDENKRHIPWREVRELIFDHDNPNHFQYRVSLASDEEPTSVSIKKVGHPVNLSTYKLKQAYNTLIPIAGNKYDDLQSLCSVAVKRAEDVQFYANLPVRRKEAKKA